MPTYRLHLFSVRLWREQVDHERSEWRGQVKNASTGDVRYFRNAVSLYDALLVLLNNPVGATEENRGSREEEGEPSNTS